MHPVLYGLSTCVFDNHWPAQAGIGAGKRVSCVLQECGWNFVVFEHDHTGSLPFQAD